MEVTLNINGHNQLINAHPTDTLMNALRGAGYFSVRFGSHGGETGAAAVLVDGKLVSSEVMLVGQAVGHPIETVESLTGRVGELHPIQRAFIETGAIQSGYSTPAMILAAKALLDHTLNPTEAEIRDALSGVLCRETGYIKPVEASSAPPPTCAAKSSLPTLARTSSMPATSSKRLPAMRAMIIRSSQVQVTEYAIRNTQ